MYLRTDTVPRVVQSLEALVNGMYPRASNDNSLQDIEFVPLHTVNIDLDPINADNSKFCARAAYYKNLTWAPETLTPKRAAFESRREVCAIASHATRMDQSALLVVMLRYGSASYWLVL